MQVLFGFPCQCNFLWEVVIGGLPFGVQLFAYDTVKTFLAPKPGEPSRLIIPASTVAGATAGVCSTLCTYPLELLKTRLTIQVRFIQNQGGLLEL